jgi:hypothetical protein
LSDKENNGHSLKTKKKEPQADFGNHFKSGNISLPLDQLSKTVTLPFSVQAEMSLLILPGTQQCSSVSILRIYTKI